MITVITPLFEPKGNTMEYLTQDYFDFIMTETDYEAELQALREQAQHDWDLEQD